MPATGVLDRRPAMRSMCRRGFGRRASAAIAKPIEKPIEKLPRTSWPVGGGMRLGGGGGRQATVACNAGVKLTPLQFSRRQ